MKYVLNFIFAFSLLSSIANSQNEINKPYISVLNFESVGLENSSKQLGAMIRLEVMKLDKYIVVEKHDMIEALTQHSIDLDNCYSTSCMAKAGEAMKSDFALSGTFEVFGKKLVVNFKLYDVKKKQLINSVAYEYINHIDDIEKIGKISIQKLLNTEIDKELENIYNYSIYEKREILNSDLKMVNLSGPRFGLVYLTGINGNAFTDPNSQGGFGAGTPIMTQVGYQWEKSYLNAGSSQALFEVIPMLSGMDKGFITPSINFLNGFRLNKSGWELGFGPSFRITKEAEGYMSNINEKSTWISKRDARYDHQYAQENPDELFYRLDKRGVSYARTSWLISVGKTLKSGTLNIPINAYANFSGNGNSYGISMGYNISKH